MAAEGRRANLIDFLSDQADTLAMVADKIQHLTLPGRVTSVAYEVDFSLRVPSAIPPSISNHPYGVSPNNISSTRQIARRA